MDVNGSVGVGVNECQRVEHRAQKVRSRNLREETGSKKEQSGISSLYSFSKEQGVVKKFPRVTMG